MSRCGADHNTSVMKRSMTLAGKLVGGLMAAFLIAGAVNLAMFRFGPWADPPWFTLIWAALSVFAILFVLWRHFGRTGRRIVKE